MAWIPNQRSRQEMGRGIDYKVYGINLSDGGEYAK